MYEMIHHLTIIRLEDQLALLDDVTDDNDELETKERKKERGENVTRQHGDYSHTNPKRSCCRRVFVVCFCLFLPTFSSECPHVTISVNA